MTAIFARRASPDVSTCPLFSEAIIAKKRLRLSLDKGCEKGVFRLMEQIAVKIRLAVPTTA
ncbi:hypothetical protein QCE47_12570 [Caballeronia sp. LZ025]|jgi:hypothetical protein|uniref:hypothetical protein n=1 Tax=Caballeronia TaxID=1827195 RepID=UPI001FD587AA|nr:MULTISPECIES: hypothetical protein [Caballeronia]MDR5733174.1 hypothetical protein [Caballeronia sp. LZ025]